MKKILTILSEYGYWGEELVGPLEILEKNEYTLEFATPSGKKPLSLPPSRNSDYIDSPLNKPVTTKEMANKVIELETSTKLDNPLNLRDIMPERPYLSDTNYLRKLEEYYNNLDKASEKLNEYEALLIIGGSGPIVDMVNNQRVHDIILDFYKKNKLIAAECYGVACLAFARDIRDRKSILKDKHVTGHPIEYDYKDGTGFLNSNLNMGPPPYPLEYILRDTVGENGQYHGNVGNKTSVILDYPFLTSRSTASSYLCGEIMVQCLKNNVKKFGW